MKRLIVLAGFIALFASCEKDKGCVAKPKADCVCTKEYVPVCGCNAVTYGNKCMAECDGITEYRSGECPK